MIKFDFPVGGSHPAVVGIGVFDGVHLGHRKIISSLSEMGRRLGASPVALTFFPHPREVLCPNAPPRLLLPPEERIKKLLAAGAVGVGVVNFTPETAETPPEDFLVQLLVACPHIRGVCVGAHWRFGRCGAGDAAFLERRLAELGIAFEAVPELHMNGRIVSSSAIRSAISEGDLANASAMLGVPPSLFGEVEHGFGEAGPKLNAPTANLRTDFGVLPPDGVYAAWTVTGGSRFPALVNVGVSPTFRKTGGQRRVEAHVIDFHGDLYGHRLALELVKKLRDERTFPSPEALEHQIRCDREQALRILETTGGAS